MKTRFKIKTLGCKVNQYESQIIREQFLTNGFIEVEETQTADMCVINTCTVTHTSEAKSNRLIKSVIKNNPGAKVIVTGCEVTANSINVAKIPGVSFVVQNKNKYEMLERLNDCMNGDKKFKRLSVISGFNSRTRAFVKVEDGCNNFCSYCIVPYVRGRVISRGFNEIISEVKGLVNNGVKEIVLTGICLGSFGKDLKDDKGLIELIEEIENIYGDFRIRLSSIEPWYITDALIEHISGSNKLCPHLHIPFQSGDNEVLKRMNRKMTVEQAKDLVDKLKSMVHNIAISTDIITGFPGEKEEHFENTIEFLKYISPMRIHVFSYSRRKGTAAYAFKGVVADKIISDRVQFLKKIADKMTFKYIEKFNNKIEWVIIEDSKDKTTGFWKGYSERYIKVLIKNNISDRINEILPVRIVEVKDNYAIGEIL